MGLLFIVLLFVYVSGCKLEIEYRTIILCAGYTAHVMTFEVGAVLEDPNWQAPVYCFNNGTEKERSVSLLESGAVGRGDSFGRLMRGTGIAANAAETL